jgi:hypothetical protein
MSAILQRERALQEDVICCLLSVEIDDYAAKPVFDQIRLTQDFQSLLSDTTANVSSGDLISVVREDGALLSFLSDPQGCFATALAIQESASTGKDSHGIALHIGINLGAVQIAKDEFGHPHVSGTGRQDAERAMRRGPSQQISVSRSFVESLSHTAPELSDLLEYQGVFSDNVEPPLCLYALAPPRSAEQRRLLEAPPPQVALASASPARKGLGIDAAPFNVRPRFLWLQMAALAMLLCFAVLVFFIRFGIHPTPTTTTPPAATPSDHQVLGTPAPSIALSTEAPMLRPALEPSVEPAEPPSGLQRNAKSVRESPIARLAPAKRIAEQELPEETRPPEEVAAPIAVSTKQAEIHGSKDAVHADVPKWIQSRNASLRLAVKPWGEIFVDGKSVGITPPLKTFELPPGPHQITITNSPLPSYRLQVTLDPEEQITVSHDFDCAWSRENQCREGRGLVLNSRPGEPTQLPGRR